ncbi:MAG: acyltransferase [Pseudonocardia sp.]|nr:acyltransferase [Pseudonocardia sp.]
MTIGEPPTVPIAPPSSDRSSVRTVAEPGGVGRSPSLAEAFDPRHNSVNALRLGLATLVLLSHTLKLHGGFDPLGRLTGGDVDMGTIAVDGFFALSGYLIVGSYLNSPTTGRYLWRRALRILPGFWVCLLLTAFVLLPLAQLIEFGTLADFPLTGDQSALSYLTNNAALFIRQFEVDGLFGGGTVNGSLYTLFYEFLCYLGVAALGAVGLLRFRTWPLVGLTVAGWLLAVSEIFTDAAVTSRSTTIDIALRFGLMFLAGAVLHRLARHIPLGWVGGSIAGLALGQAVVLATLVGPDPTSTLVYLTIAPPAVAYLVVLAGANPRLHRIGSKRDLSYGLYVYAWPVQALLLLVGARGWPVLGYGATSLAVALLLAWASWTWVESPALRYKSWTPKA